MSWLTRLRNAVNSRQLDDDLSEEMRYHLERRVEALKEQGVSAEEARRQVTARFGNITRWREQGRDYRLWAALEGTLQDVRYAWRGMRKGPAFAVTAVLSLALAIGANTAIYSIMDAAMLRPLPVSKPDELFTLTWPDIQDPGSPAGQERVSFSYPEFLQFVAASRGAARLALFSSGDRVEAQGSEPGASVEKIDRQFVSGQAFDMLGVPPAVGRLFSAEDDRLPPGRPVAVLSYDYWRRRFHADPAIVGRSLKIEGKAYEITGVAREGFFGVEPGRFVDVWVPGTHYDSQALNDPYWHWFRILGRFAPGVSPEQLQARLQPSFHGFQEGLVKLMPTMPPAIREQFLDSAIRVHPAPTGASDFRKWYSRPLWIVFGVAVGILVIASANVASLLLARSTARSAEMAMRVSLGAGRVRLVRQLLTESLLLSLLAGGLGWLLARVTAPLLVHVLSTQSNPVQLVLALNSRVLFFCIAVSTLSAVFFGLLPAWQASGVQPMLALRGLAGQAGKLRLGKVFVSIQVACAFCLIMVGAAFLFSLRNLLAVNPGFDPRNVAVLSLTTESGKKGEQAASELMFQLEKRVESQPGVQGAALAAWPIFEGGGMSHQILIPGKAPSQQEEVFYPVSPTYFGALRTPLLAGRTFNRSDSAMRQPVPAIVNEAFARKYFARLNPLGREFAYPRGKTRVRNVIVGVAADAHYYNLRGTADPTAYIPIDTTLGFQNSFALYVRSPLTLGSLVRLVDREAHGLGSGVRVREVTTLETLVGNTLLSEKLLAGVGGAFAFFGLILAAIGLFGLLSYSVGRRTKEIGIRAALGAERAGLVLLVLKDLIGLMGAGLIVGLAASLAIITVFKSLLFGIRDADPLVMGASAALFLVTGLIAAGFPAHRAATLDPMRALREE
ncbi:MAG: ABC transporter permease [Bryobacteraceae bacterium]